jgi:hypothetical protein
MTFDWGKRLNARAGLVDENLGLRNERLRQQIEASRGPSGAPSIIGGQLVDPGDTAGRNAAVDRANSVAAEVKAQRSLRGQFGSPNVRSMAGRSGSAAGGGATELTMAGTADSSLRDIVPNGDFVNPTGFTDPLELNSISESVSSTPPPRRRGPPRIIEETSGTIADAMNEREYRFEGGRGTGRSGYGFRDGGMVMKPKMVKQPGYKNGGKVKIPGQDCAPGYEMGGQIGPEVTKWAGEKKKKKGMRGYAKSGKIGKVSEDDGMDTVDVRTREGEYLLNPETVEFLGGGDYQQGVRMLDETVMQATGEAPGPVPVNEEGEAMRGFRKGGKMGYAAGGTSYAWVPGEGRVNYPQPPRGAPTMDPMWTRGVDVRGAAQRAGSALRDFATGPKAVRAAGWANRGAGYIAPAVEAYQTAAVAADDDMTGIDAATQAASGLGRLGAAGAGAALGSMAGPVGTLVGGATGYILGDEAIKAGRRLLNTEVNDPYDRLGAREIPPAAGTDEQEIAPNQFYRPFSGGAVDLRGMPEQAASTAVDPGQMAVVQRTGGPDGEVIVREDVADGSYVDSEGNPISVPTFSNLRTAPQAGDAATLQAQADARAADDMRIRANQTAVVDQMRDSAPLYNREQIAQRRAEQAAAAANAPKAKRVATDKRITERFRVPQYDEDGKLEGYVEDQEKLTAFKDAMALLGVDVYALDEAQQDSLFEEFEPIYADIAMANSAARGQDRPISTMPRTGERALRRIPGSNITLGNVMGPEATLGDWWAGVFDGDPINDEFVQDPETGAIIPARRALRRQGDTIDARRKYGYLPPE